MFLHASIQWYCAISVFLLCGIVVLAQKSKADPLLNTDDASITAAHRCQLESAYSHSTAGTWSYQVAPACNFAENLELSVGYHASKDIDNVHGFSAQAKTVLKPMGHFWGIASSLMLSQDDQSQHFSDLDWFLNLPMSFNLSPHLAVDTNLGYQYAHDHSHLIRWGIATHYSLNDRWVLNAETYNQDRDSPFFQTAAHYSLIPNILTFEATFGDRFNAFRQRWFGLGLSYTP
ncbi:hypothetical protein [Acinetobacter nematophilus]|uniref:Uncharacterized protein n=1 Tax=Acinetobacter nematophilus TaxID=2994642 RepID=A0A9X3IHD0_9GAMM|nr:hypothetical protein [Acinetobacter nematophilus]MCX5468667.1 hypothetical protein [Acinetobacter nematophilus]